MCRGPRHAVVEIDTLTRSRPIAGLFWCWFVLNSEALSRRAVAQSAERSHGAVESIASGLPRITGRGPQNPRSRGDRGPMITMGRTVRRNGPPYH